MTKIDTSREEYIKAIYKLCELHGSATNKNLAELLGVTAPSVTEMVRRLGETEDVYLEKKEIFLTEKGREEARKLLTKHRLWELFLVDYLGYSWQDVHEDADVLEHVTSERLKDRLNEFMNHPKHCPHGSEIFENHPDADKLIGLSEMKVGQSGKVHKLSDDKAFLNYIEEKKLYIDQEIMIQSIDSFDHSVLVKTDFGSVYIAGQAAKRIKILIG